MIPTTTETPSEVKARGAFYTPARITSFMAGWAIRDGNDHALEPACGDGAFVDAIVSRLRELGGQPSQVVGVELHGDEAAKVLARAPKVDVRNVDFFDLDPQEVGLVDAVVGNPPYIRYQDFGGAAREKAQERSRAQQVALTGLASSWAHFVVHSISFLRSNGRLALVLPAELLLADYAGPVRAMLAERFSAVTIVAFDRMVFDDAEVDAVLLLASNDERAGLRVIQLPDDRALETLVTAGEIVRPDGLGRWSAAINPTATAVYTSIVDRLSTTRLGDIATVDIGFVSGANAFFVLSADEAAAADLPDSVLLPAVVRPRDAPGLVARNDAQRRLLHLDVGSDLDPATLRYLARGVRLLIHERYKCRKRRPWYAVPLPRRRADALIPYMSHFGPRLILNPHGARNSNLLHGVALATDAPDVRALSAAMCSSVTLLSAEIEGRAYGGGVLKLETKEAERLRIPSFDHSTELLLVEHFDAVAGLVERGDAKGAAVLVDEILGVDHASVWSAYAAYRSRRLGRKRNMPH